MTPKPVALERFLRPASVAIVGASERQPRSNYAAGAMRDTGIELFFVNPNRREAYGRPTSPTIAAVGHPVDAVLSLVPAQAAIDVIVDARGAGAGGVVVIAGGFGETGPEGAKLERRLADAAGDMPVLGPNCNGFVRPRSGARLSGAPPLPLPAGPIGIISQSGALLAAFGLAVVERAVGISTVITTGNEMALDLAACLDFLIGDPETTVIGLVVETVRDPARFFAAARRAVAAGKPVVALKLGRSERGREIATSHTGALAGEPWVYDVTFRQHGISMARDLADLLDRLAIVAQLPAERWSPVRGLGVLSMSGGWSAMAGDVCAEEGIALPPLHGIRDAVNAIIPERSTVNPLDMTGFAQGRADIVTAISRAFLASGDVDALLLQWFLDEQAEEISTAITQSAIAAAASARIPVVVGSVEDGHPGGWARALPEQGVVLGRGLRGTVRGLRTMADFVRHREALGDHAAVAPLPVSPPAAAPVDSAAGPMLPFDATMELLTAIGIPVAPYVMIEPSGTVAGAGIGFGAPYVAKLADIPHRTELSAVRTGIAAADLAAVVEVLRGTARRAGLPERVVVQPHLRLDGELFVGAETASDLGPLVLCGLGGVQVESMRRITGRLAPLAAADVAELIGELRAFYGERGRRPWDVPVLEGCLLAAARLAAGTNWLRSLDINPLAVTADGFVAVDGLCLLRT